VHWSLSGGDLHRTVSAVWLFLRADIVSQIENAIGSFFGSILSGIQSFFGNIFAAISNLFASIFSAPVNAIDASWASLNGFTSGWGPLAPIITVVIVVIVVLIAVIAIWVVIRVSTSEAEKEGDEIEEGE
jgi:hypothetical protein